MAIEKAVLNQLKKFATAFRDARDRGANEADTVMFLMKFFEDVLSYESLKGDISRELPVKDRFCDFSLRVEGETKILVEAKAASVKGLVEKHIEQAENYASRAGLRWVVLTNGIEWKLYHLTFLEGEGITHDLAFEANLLNDLDIDPDALWAKLSLLTKASVQKGALESFWEQKKVLSPSSLVRVLFGHEVLVIVRRELKKVSGVNLELQDVFNAIRDALSKESLLEAGDITMAKKKKKKKKRVVNIDAATGQARVEEVEVESSEDDENPTIPFDQTGSAATA